MLWRKALAQSTEGLFLLFLFTSVWINSLRHSALTYSWLDILLAVFMLLQIRRYYQHHKQLYLAIYQRKVQQLKRYLATPEHFQDSKIQEIIKIAATARARGQLAGFAASLASVSYNRLDAITQRMVHANEKRWYYLDTLILLSIVTYAVITIWMLIRDLW
ncbi:MAG: hypothetical protein K6F95_03275 [Selenomonas sp.]|uniref:hypothetical protein n=1 Tax=Selenomonas sp. TaxID=2053611 RepID=UPI0025D80308|nr:hypothetical protein [Selenomonas sp.]MCR5756910.1 hypothetical protein [Selenomonas sp.]